MAEILPPPPLDKSIVAVVRIDGLPPNPNVTKGQHWSKIHKSYQEWQFTSRMMARQAYKGRPLEKAHLHYHISVGDNRIHDLDNIIASLKKVQDGLIGICIIDDSIDSITVSYSVDRAKPRGVTITVKTGLQE